ncbi:FAD:protein FMN transferase [Neptunomonas phycophila]|uniref:FAD:protein FMN transferase n=1 Tax=Neptunomonas phycophila TaxID=1572645 RepID=UPI001BECC82C|nr:FAD:protein FMN transferase [Neptunomonas phycophila]MBT3146257.1 FAD:protein FMN transferase [Neptunomonas phycophila]
MKDALKSIPHWPAALLLAFLFLVGCSQQKNDVIVSTAGMTMGTTYSVKWVDSDDNRVTDIHNKIETLLKAVNQSMSTYIDDSELSTFNKMPAESTITASDGLFHVLSLAQQISQHSDGAFDVTVGPLVNLWGFGPDGRIVKAPKEDEINNLRNRIGYEKLELIPESRQVTKHANTYVDLSAIAKGYGVDAVAQLLEEQGIQRYLVEIGGELRASGLKPNEETWRIAIESPAGAERSVQRIVHVSDTGIATSGDYRNYFEEEGVRYSHTIDPSTGHPITHKLASVTVLSATCAEADALATAFTVMGEEKAMAYAKAHKVDAFFIVKSQNGFKEMMTPGFEARLVK